MKGWSTVTFSNLSNEEIQEMSLVEIAYELMKQEKQPFLFHDLVKRAAEIKGISKEVVAERISYLYTDLNVDGRFISLGENRWGLRTWYPYEQAEEEVTQTVKRKKSKRVDDDEEDLEIELDEDFDDLDEELDDEFEDIEDELDDLISEEDEESEDFDLDLDEEETEEEEIEDDLEEDEEEEI